MPFYPVLPVSTLVFAELVLVSIFLGVFFSSCEDSPVVGSGTTSASSSMEPNTFLECYFAAETYVPLYFLAAVVIPLFFLSAAIAWTTLRLIRVISHFLGVWMWYYFSTLGGNLTILYLCVALRVL